MDSATMKRRTVCYGASNLVGVLPTAKRRKLARSWFKNRLSIDDAKTIDSSWIGWSFYRPRSIRNLQKSRQNSVQTTENSNKSLGMDVQLQSISVQGIENFEVSLEDLYLKPDRKDTRYSTERTKNVNNLEKPSFEDLALLDVAALHNQTFSLVVEETDAFGRFTQTEYETSIKIGSEDNCLSMSYSLNLPQPVSSDLATKGLSKEACEAVESDEGYGAGESPHSADDVYSKQHHHADDLFFTRATNDEIFVNHGKSDKAKKYISTVGAIPSTGDQEMIAGTNASTSRERDKSSAVGLNNPVSMESNPSLTYIHAVEAQEDEETEEITKETSQMLLKDPEIKRPSPVKKKDINKTTLKAKSSASVKDSKDGSSKRKRVSSPTVFYPIEPKLISKQNPVGTDGIGPQINAMLSTLKTSPTLELESNMGSLKANMSSELVKPKALLPEKSIPLADTEVTSSGNSVKNLEYNMDSPETNISSELVKPKTLIPKNVALLADAEVSSSGKSVKNVPSQQPNSLVVKQVAESKLLEDTLIPVADSHSESLTAQDSKNAEDLEIDTAILPIEKQSSYVSDSEITNIDKIIAQVAEGRNCENEMQENESSQVEELKTPALSDPRTAFPSVDVNRRRKTTSIGKRRGSKSKLKRSTPPSSVSHLVSPSNNSMTNDEVLTPIASDTPATSSSEDKVEMNQAGLKITHTTKRRSRSKVDTPSSTPSSTPQRTSGRKRVSKVKTCPCCVGGAGHDDEHSDLEDFDVLPKKSPGRIRTGVKGKSPHVRDRKDVKHPVQPATSMKKADLVLEDPLALNDTVPASKSDVIKEGTQSLSDGINKHIETDKAVFTESPSNASSKSSSSSSPLNSQESPNRRRRGRPVGWRKALHSNKTYVEFCEIYGDLSQSSSGSSSSALEKAVNSRDDTESHQPGTEKPGASNGVVSETNVSKPMHAVKPKRKRRTEGDKPKATTANTEPAETRMEAIPSYTTPVDQIQSIATKSAANDNVQNRSSSNNMTLPSSVPNLNPPNMHLPDSCTAMPLDPMSMIARSSDPLLVNVTSAQSVPRPFVNSSATSPPFLPPQIPLPPQLFAHWNNPLLPANIQALTNPSSVHQPPPPTQTKARTKADILARLKWKKNARNSISEDSMHSPRSNNGDSPKISPTGFPIPSTRESQIKKQTGLQKTPLKNVKVVLKDVQRCRSLSPTTAHYMRKATRSRSKSESGTTTPKQKPYLKRSLSEKKADSAKHSSSSSFKRYILHNEPVSSSPNAAKKDNQSDVTKETDEQKPSTYHSALIKQSLTMHFQRYILHNQPDSSSDTEFTDHMSNMSDEDSRQSKDRLTPFRRSQSKSPAFFRVVHDKARSSVFDNKASTENDVRDGPIQNKPTTINSSESKSLLSETSLIAPDQASEANTLSKSLDIAEQSKPGTSFSKVMLQKDQDTAVKGSKITETTITENTTSVKSAKNCDEATSTTVVNRSGTVDYIATTENTTASNDQNTCSENENATIETDLKDVSEKTTPEEDEEEAEIPSDLEPDKSDDEPDYDEWRQASMLDSTTEDNMYEHAQTAPMETDEDTQGSGKTESERPPVILKESAFVKYAGGENKSNSIESTSFKTQVAGSKGEMLQTIEPTAIATISDDNVQIVVLNSQEVSEVTSTFPAPEPIRFDKTSRRSGESTRDSTGNLDDTMNSMSDTEVPERGKSRGEAEAGGDDIPSLAALAARAVPMSKFTSVTADDDSFDVTNPYEDISAPSSPSDTPDKLSYSTPGQTDHNPALIAQEDTPQLQSSSGSQKTCNSELSDKQNSQELHDSTPLTASHASQSLSTEMTTDPIAQFSSPIKSDTHETEVNVKQTMPSIGNSPTQSADDTPRADVIGSTSKANETENNPAKSVSNQIKDTSNN